MFGAAHRLYSRARHQVGVTGKIIKGELQNPPWRPPGHYYSPRTSASDRERAKSTLRDPVGVLMNEAGQVELARRLRFEVPREARWRREGNFMFGPNDASILRSVLLDRRPRRVIEVGSGFSTAVMLDVAETDLPDLQITCVEPYADRLRSLMRPGDAERVTLIEKPVQDIEPDDLVRDLEPGDIFFIDSTHVAKAGSDVLHLFLHTLPLIPSGIMVHVHDIFWPFEYPGEWIDERRDWNESYFLHAFLMNNSDWTVQLFGSWLWHAHPDVAAPGTESQSPASFWMIRN
jgi:predicted O-methyltransferase YrrM